MSRAPRLLHHVLRRVAWLSDCLARNRWPHRLALAGALGTLLLVAGCATPGAPPDGPGDTGSGPPAPLAARLDPALGDRLLALDPEHVSARDVREVLARGPAPRIINIHGGIYPVHLAMEDFAEFLLRMGYPERAVRHPGDGSLSRSPYEPSERIAGLIAWSYERDGLRPMLIGHSQGGIQVVKVLYELAGAFDDAVPVWDPVAEAPLPRTTIVDPLTGRTRPVVGLSVCYASAVGAGGASMILPNHWKMAGRLYTIPDTVEAFTGFTIGVDLFALDLADLTAEAYRNNGRATVRNVKLPAGYNHVVVPLSLHLAQDEGMRDWIDAYEPGASPPPPAVAPSDAADPPGGARGSAGKYGYGPGDSANAYWAADVWHSIKKHWTLEAQRLIRARRAARGAG